MHITGRRTVERRKSATEVAVAGDYDQLVDAKASRMASTAISTRVLPFETGRPFRSDDCFCFSQ